ncbi:MAG: hypothetical protein N4A37_14165 [Prolixibacteraceae bacterium]|nr:hypothetical protein [Prolixibacteraceae bacterium]
MGLKGGLSMVCPWFVHGSSMVRPWFVHRFWGFRWRNHGATMDKPWRKYGGKYYFTPISVLDLTLYCI